MCMWKERLDLGLQSVELCLGTHGYKYALIKTVKKKRVVQLQRLFEAHDRDATPGMQIKLTNLPDEHSIVSFGQGYGFKYHAIYKEIERARQTHSPDYFASRPRKVITTNTQS